MPESAHLEKPLAIIGEEDAVLGFQALGFKVYPVRNLTQATKADISNGVYPVKDPQEFKAALDEVMVLRPAVCLVQDNIYRAQEAQINAYKNLAVPVFIPFTKDAKTNLLDELVKGIRLKATGTF